MSEYLEFKTGDRVVMCTIPLLPRRLCGRGIGTVVSADTTHAHIGWDDGRVSYLGLRWLVPAPLLADLDVLKIVREVVLIAKRCVA